MSVCLSKEWGKGEHLFLHPEMFTCGPKKSLNVTCNSLTSLLTSILSNRSITLPHWLHFGGHLISFSKKKKRNPASAVLYTYSISIVVCTKFLNIGA